ncbi:replication A1-like protein [Trifolium pratense]|uniref:Replication A1-like protein n=1 Tax=Trifolium pratense TaxID=57577 RepID=A0A2K3NXI5_TRIPR|nr:replication A1-like protein [Trifolium pratense]
MLMEVASDHLLEPALEELSEMTQATICQVSFRDPRTYYLQSLTLAKNMAIDELVCYFDSLHYINLIKGPNINYHVYVVLIQDIKELVSQSNTTLCHALREGNNCADFLDSSDSDLTTHAFPPESLFDILRSDAAETFYLYL